MKKRLITDFSNIANQEWRIVNDGVMGGRSSSRMQLNEDGNAVFLGELSLENNGGFASVKNHEPINIDGFSTIHLRVKGDGNRYSFRLRTGEGSKTHEWSYQVKFETKPNEWIDVRLPLTDFEATYRGSKPENVPPPDFSSIRQFGFLISDKQEGKFRLEIEKMEVGN